MRVRFIHVADLHLGYQQYNLEVRADDFARAYFAMVEHAIEVKADFVLIAGDLFHKSNPDAWSLKQATAGLQQLRSANIPAVAIEGNHDAPHVHRHLSWLEYLCDQVWIVGSPATVVRKIRDLHAAVGGFGGLMIGATEWSDASIWRRSMDLFTGEVMPELANLNADVPIPSGRRS